MKRPTACLDCKFFLNVSVKGDTTWYYNYCKASPRPLEYNYLTGVKEKPVPEFQHCRDVNQGNCKLFSPKTLDK